MSLSNIKEKIQKFRASENSRNILWLLSEKFLSITVAIFVGAWVTRFLGPENFGLLSYAQSIVYPFSILVALGLDGVLVRELVRRPNDKQILLCTAFIMKLIASILLFFAMSVVYLSVEDNELGLLLMIISFASIFQAFGVVDSYYQSIVKAKIMVKVRTIVLLVSSILKIISIQLNLSLEYFAVITVVEAAFLSGLMLYVYMKGSDGKIKFLFRLDEATSMMKDSSPLLISAILMAVYMRIDQIIVKNFLTVKEVGEYVAATKLSEAMHIIPHVIANTYYPSIIKTKQIGGEIYQLKMLSLYRMMFLISVVTMALIFVSADLIISLLYGVQYENSVNVLRIHVWSGVFVGMFIVSGRWLIAENMGYEALGRNLTALFFVSSLGIMLVPIYGINGAAFAALGSYILSGYLYDFFIKKTRPQFYLKSRAMFLWKRK
ncbi:flippase [Limnobacter sp.]|uniref:flippase n=1 Tax=Limnobacter sp. TaxID=2003368 RepID=UPI0039C8F00D